MQVTTIFVWKAVSMLFCAGAILMPFSCQQPDSYEIKISGPVTIGAEWIELYPKEPLKAEKDLQMVFLDLEPPLKGDLYKEGKEPNKGKGILMPDGEVINPEIEVLDQYGNGFKLVYSGGIGFKPTYNLLYPGTWPLDREYKAIRIRSPRPIMCKAISWFCESRKDWP
jgi:hypothetical protein